MFRFRISQVCQANRDPVPLIERNRSKPVERRRGRIARRNPRAGSGSRGYLQAGGSAHAARCRPWRSRTPTQQVETGYFRFLSGDSSPERRTSESCPVATRCLWDTCLTRQERSVSDLGAPSEADCLVLAPDLDQRPSRNQADRSGGAPRLAATARELGEPFECRTSLSRARDPVPARPSLR